MPIKKIKQKKIKGKQKKKATPKKRANVVAQAPTRDVIININTTRPRARREPSQKVIPKRNEDLSARIIESELFQSNFRATQLIKEQAEKIKLFDRRLSVLTDVIDNERRPPLITEPATDQPPPVAEAIRTPSQDIQVAEIVSEPAKPERPRQSVFLQQLLSERENQEILKQQAQRQEESERASLKARQLGEEQEEQPLERKKAGQGQPLERKKKAGRPALTPEQKEENKRIREQEAKKLVQQQKPPETQPRKLSVLELMKLNQGEGGDDFFKVFGGRKV